jgi:hypothetical protein
VIELGDVADPEAGPRPDAQPTVSLRRPGAGPPLCAQPEEEPATREDSGPDAGADEVVTGGLADSLPGYQFLKCVSYGRISEVWHVQLPDGRQGLARFVHGFASAATQAKWEAVVRVKWSAHPALLPAEIVQSEPGRVILITDLVEHNVRHRFEQHRRQGLPGIPRWELIEMLRPVGEALDLLARQSEVRHLSLTPASLLWHEGQLRVVDAGLAQALADPVGASWQAPRGRPREAPYSPPEWFLNRQASASTDSYSLALIYAEMLTGRHPLHRMARHSGDAAGRRWQPDLDAVPGPDRAVLARALHGEPARRFPDCTALLDALRGCRPKEDSARLFTGELPPVIVAPAEPAALAHLIAAGQPGTAPPLEHLLGRMVATAAGQADILEYQQIRYLLRPGELLQHRCAAHLPPGVLPFKLDGFCQRWRASVRYCDDRAFDLFVPVPRDVWQFCLGRQVGLHLELRLAQPQGVPTHLSEVGVVIKPAGCNRNQAVQVLATVGPVLLESLRSYLQAIPEMRTQERLAYYQRVRVSPVLANCQLGGLIECQAKDISLKGIGFFLPRQPPSPQFYVNTQLPDEATELALLARAVRVKPVGNGWYEIGALFGGARKP